MALVQETLEKTCEECGKKYEADRFNYTRQRFCCRKCKEISRYKDPEYRKYHKLYSRKHWRSPQWLKYQQEYWKTRNKTDRLELMNYLGGVRCRDCGSESYDNPRLEFHHINPKHSKEDRLRFKDSRPMVRYYLKHLDEAKQKLQVLCGPCNASKNRKY